MRCEKVREQMEDGGQPALAGAARHHLEACASCQAYAQDAHALSEGLRLLAREPGPDPSWGFTARVLCQLSEVSGQRLVASAFLEKAGRRVVLATLVLILTLFLAMILPSSGPFRQSQQLDVYWPPTQMAATGYSPVPAGNLPPLPVVVDVDMSRTAFHR